MKLYTTKLKNTEEQSINSLKISFQNIKKLISLYFYHRVRKISLKNTFGLSKDYKRGDRLLVNIM